MTDPPRRPRLVRGAMLSRVERQRVVYAQPWRIEITQRAGAPWLLSDAALARSIDRALEAARAPKPAAIGLILTGDEEITALNSEQMGHAGPTDVLSFPLLPPEAFPGHPGKARAEARQSVSDRFPGPRGRLHLGEIVVSVERAIEQAEQGRGGHTGDVKWSPKDELRLLVTHGVLHLCGWDHADPDEERAMRALETQLLGPQTG